MKCRKPCGCFGNAIAQEGITRCFCGCKYWENDRCIDCNTHASEIPKEEGM